MVFCSKILILFCYFSTNSHFVLYFIIFAFYFCENKVEIAQKEVEIRLTKIKKALMQIIYMNAFLLILFSLTNLAALVSLLILLAVAPLVFLPLLALFVPTL